MKRLIIPLVLLALAGPVFAQPLETTQPTPILVAAVEANDTALDANTTSWTYASAWTQIPQRFNTLKVMFYASEPNDPNGESLDANDCTFSYAIYVADYGTSGQLVASGSATVGDKRLSHNPVTLAAVDTAGLYCWVDTLGTVTSDWPKDPTTGNDGGLDDASCLLFDRMSGRTMDCIITSRSTAYLHVWCIAYGY